MKRSVTTALTTVFALLIGCTATYLYFNNSHERTLGDLLSKLLNVEKELTQTKSDLLGYTKYTDYLSVTKSAMEGKMKFLAAKVDREYVHIEHIQKSTLGVQTDATIIVTYNVEYSFGYDLKQDSFSVSRDKSGITVVLRKPELVASPAVQILTHEIVSTGVFIDEKAAVIALQQKLPGVAKQRAGVLAKDEAVTALCEKKLADFLRDFLAKQPNVTFVPTIKVAYK